MCSQADAPDLPRISACKFERGLYLYGLSKAVLHVATAAGVCKCR